MVDGDDFDDESDGKAETEALRKQAESSEPINVKGFDFGALPTPTFAQKLQQKRKSSVTSIYMPQVEMSETRKSLTLALSTSSVS